MSSKQRQLKIRQTVLKDIVWSGIEVIGRQDYTAREVLPLTLAIAGNRACIRRLMNEAARFEGEVHSTQTEALPRDVLSSAAPGFERMLVLARQAVVACSVSSVNVPVGDGEETRAVAPLLR